MLHGTRTYLLQDDDGQTLDSHSISAGLDYPGVGPEHAWLNDTGRAEYRPVTDAEAMDAFALLCRTEGIIPAIESAHALAGALKLGRELGPDAPDPGQPVRPRRQGRGHRRRVVRTSRRGVSTHDARERAAFAKAAAESRAALDRLPAGRVPRRTRAIRPPSRWREAGADVVEVGLPYSDPLMDGPVIADAVHQSLKGGTRITDVLRHRRGDRRRAAPPPWS